QQVAMAVAAGIRTHCPVGLVEVGEATEDLGGIDLLVVGAPTHALGLSRPDTRETATKQAPHGVVSGRRGVREWLEALDRSHNGLVVATFDTRLGKPRWLTGSAAKAAAKRLTRLGYRLVAAPESFIVHGTTGPLGDNELVRAHGWGEQLAKATRS